MENANWEAADTALHEEKINLRHYWHVILERRWLVIAAFCSVFALCLIYLFKAERIYPSRLMDVEVQQPNPQPAAPSANPVAETFNQENPDRKMNKAIEALHW